MIVVLDSGVWISALQFGGTPSLAVEKVLTFDGPALCDQIKEEVSRVLIEKMHWDVDRVQNTLAFYFQNAIWVHVSENLHGVCRDPKDDIIVECALNARADLIVSGDNDLLVVRKYKHVRIITPGEYVSGQIPDS